MGDDVVRFNLDEFWLLNRRLDSELVDLMADGTMRRGADGLGAGVALREDLRERGGARDMIVLDFSKKG